MNIPKHQAQVPNSANDALQRLNQTCLLVPHNPPLALTLYPPLDLDALDAQPRQLLDVDPRHTRGARLGALEVDDMRDIPADLGLAKGPKVRLALLGRLRDGPGKVRRRHRARRGSRLPVRLAVEDEHLVPDRRPRDGRADAPEDHGRDDARIQTTDAVHHRLAVLERRDHLGVGHRPDLVPVRVDVPHALDPAGQVLLLVLGEGVVPAQHGERPGEVGVLDAVQVQVLVPRGLEGVVRHGGGAGGVGDGYLAGEYGPVGEAGRDVVREVGVYSWKDGGGLGDGADQREEVDRRLEGAREEPGPVVGISTLYASKHCMILYAHLDKLTPSGRGFQHSPRQS